MMTSNILNINYFLRKKYTILKFLNKKHLLFIRIFFAILGFFAIIFITHSISLGRETYKAFINDDFNRAFRFMHKIFYLYIKFIVIRDDNFNFATDLSINSLRVLEKKLQLLSRNQNSHDPKCAFEGDFLLVLGAIIEKNDKNSKLDIENFNKISNHILKFKKNEFSSKVNFEKLSSPYPKRIADLNISDARKALSDWSALFLHEDLRWFVLSGTFLGLIREDSFIPHDYDIDIGIKSEDMKFEIIKKKLDLSREFEIRNIHYNQEGYIKKNTYIKTGKNLMLIKLVHLTGISLDIFIHYTIKNSCWHGSSFHRWDNTAFELETYNLNGITVLGPKDADLYLTENYGDWRNPAIDFTFITDTPNLTIMRNPTSIAMLFNRICKSENRKIYNKSLKIFKDYGLLSNLEQFDLRNV